MVNAQVSTRYTRALFFLFAAAGLHFARDLFMPIVLAVLFGLVLAPGVHLLRKLHIPPAAGAAIVLVFFVGLLGTGAYFLAQPVAVWVRRGPEVAERVSEKFQKLTRPLEPLKTALGRKSDANTEIRPQQVAPKQPGFLNTLMNQTRAFFTLAGTTFILLYFVLAAGDALLMQILREAPSASAREQAQQIGRDVKRHISKYLLAISLINLVEGALVSGGLALAGMPTPILWGALHALLNFIPYVGAITGLAVTTVVSFVSFDSIPRALVAPAVYFAVMVLDNFTSPMVLGKRLVLNPVLVFLSLMFWGWEWGLTGILVAIPILITLKIICDHVPRLQPYGRIISAK